MAPFSMARGKDESFDDYKARRKEINKQCKDVLKYKYVHVSKWWEISPENGEIIMHRGVSYRKSVE